jgi:hypothetical protein
MGRTSSACLLVILVLAEVSFSLTEDAAEGKAKTTEAFATASGLASKIKHFVFAFSRIFFLNSVTLLFVSISSENILLLFDFQKNMNNIPFYFIVKKILDDFLFCFKKAFFDILETNVKC